MSDASIKAKTSLLTVDAHTKKRNAAEKRFKTYGLIAICAGLLALVVLLTSILSDGLSSFRQSFVTIAVELPEAKLDKSGVRDPAVMAKVSTFGYAPLLDAAMVQVMVRPSHGL